LKTLILASNCIFKDGLLELYDTLSFHNKTLTHLDLSYNAIGNKGVEIIAKLFERNSTLKRLDLHNCNITQKNKLKLLSNVTKMKKYNKNGKNNKSELSINL
jgi:Ran GTPase-activating protein (RanGAP) involved in mRNA processing and transport